MYRQLQLASHDGLKVNCSQMVGMKWVCLEKHGKFMLETVACCSGQTS